MRKLCLDRHRSQAGRRAVIRGIFTKPAAQQTSGRLSMQCLGLNNIHGSRARRTPASAAERTKHGVLARDLAMLGWSDDSRELWLDAVCADGQDQSVAKAAQILHSFAVRSATLVTSGRRITRPSWRCWRPWRGSGWRRVGRDRLGRDARIAHYQAVGPDDLRYTVETINRCS